MGKFFHGWRRKIGVVTLIMALLFMAGWASSFGGNNPSDADLIDFSEFRGFPDEGEIIGLGTYNHSLCLMANAYVVEVTVANSPTPNGSSVSSDNESQSQEEIKADSDDTPLAEAVEESPGDKRLVVQDLVLRQSYPVQSTTSTWSPMLVPVAIVSVPFWSIVIPLTLLSAYLLLSNPRPRAAKPTEQKSLTHLYDPPPISEQTLLTRV